MAIIKPTESYARKFIKSNSFSAPQRRRMEILGVQKFEKLHLLVLFFNGMMLSYHFGLIIWYIIIYTLYLLVALFYSEQIKKILQKIENTFDNLMMLNIERDRFFRFLCVFFILSIVGSVCIMGCLYNNKRTNNDSQSEQRSHHLEFKVLRAQEIRIKSKALLINKYKYQFCDDQHNNQIIIENDGFELMACIYHRAFSTGFKGLFQFALRLEALINNKDLSHSPKI